MSSVFQYFDILCDLTQQSLLLKNCWFFSSYSAFSTCWISAYFLLVFVESWAKRGVNIAGFQQLFNILSMLNTCLFSASFRWKLKEMGGRFLLIKSAEFTTLKSQYCWKLAGNLLIYWWLHAESCWMSADEMRRGLSSIQNRLYRGVDLRGVYLLNFCARFCFSEWTPFLEGP